MSKPWLPAELDHLRQLSAESASLAEMAEALGRPKSSVQCKCAALRLSCRDGRGDRRDRPATRWTPERLAELRQMASTAPPKTLALHFGVTIGRMREVLTAHKIKACRQPRTAEARKALSEAQRARWAAKYPPDGPWVCTTCGVEKPVTEFPKATSQHMCRECRRVYHVATTYGITMDEYLILLAAQGGTCAICKGPETKRHHETGVLFMMAVDHDHGCCPGKKSCGKCVRALLCSRCNSVLGHVEGNGLLGGLHAYLQRFGSGSGTGDSRTELLGSVA